jgi:hypothetical protein
MIRKFLLILTLVFMCFFCFACGVSLKHIPSQHLNDVTVKRSVKVMVADIGDARIEESPDRIGQGVSYWLPVSFYARDEKGEILPVSYYLASSLKEDLGKVGYKAYLANDVQSRLPMDIDKAKRAARKQKMDYLITTKVVEGKTNFWGFIVIQFAEPVWTRIELECELINMRNNKTIPIKTVKKEIEWYFGKITILDAVYDAGLFGKTWHQTAWGKTVISDALAEAAQKFSENIK